MSTGAVHISLDGITSNIYTEHPHPDPDTPVDDKYIRKYVKEQFLVCMQEFTHNRRRNTMHAGTTEKWTNQFMAAYTTPERPYHNLRHLYGMIIEFDRLITGRASCTKGIQLDSVMAYIFFHDWVKDPRESSQEKLHSAEIWRRFAIENAIDDDLLEHVTRCIKATSKHDFVSSGNAREDAEMKLCLDLDYAILGESKDKYRRYSKQMREECGCPNWMEFAEHRKETIEDKLGRERLYLTDDLHVKLEDTARGNLNRELGSLKRKMKGPLETMKMSLRKSFNGDTSSCDPTRP